MYVNLAKWNRDAKNCVPFWHSSDPSSKRCAVQLYCVKIEALYLDMLCINGVSITLHHLFKSVLWFVEMVSQVTNFSGGPS